MSPSLNALAFVVACLSGWLNERQQQAIDYLTEEKRILREQLGSPDFWRFFQALTEHVQELAKKKVY